MVGEVDVIGVFMALLAQGMFEYKAQKDVMTDGITHIAHMEFENDSSLVIACGSETDGKLVVNYKPQELLTDFKGGLLLPFTNRVRFGDEPPLDLVVEYRSGTVLFQGKSAWAFFDGVASSHKVAIEYEDFTRTTRRHSFRLIGNWDIVEPIEKNCPRPKGY